MTTKEKALFNIKSAWAGTPIEAICITIVNHLSQGSHDIRVINETTLQIWTKSKYSSDDLLQAAIYLSGRTPHLLDKQFIFELGDDDELALSLTDIVDAENNGYMPHPSTGKRLYNYEDYISFYFKPSKEARFLVE